MSPIRTGKIARMNIPDPYPDEKRWFRRIAEAPTRNEALDLIVEEFFPFLTEAERHVICNWPRSRLTQNTHFGLAMWIRNRYFHSGPKLSLKFGNDQYQDEADSDIIIEMVWERLRRETGGKPYPGEAFDPECLSDVERGVMLQKAKSDDPQAMLEQAMCLFYDASMSFSPLDDPSPEERDRFRFREDRLYREALCWLQKAESCDGYPQAEYFIGRLQEAFWCYLDRDRQYPQELELNRATCRKSALEWLQRAAADGIVLAHSDIAALQGEHETDLIPGSWRKAIQAREIFDSLNKRNSSFVSVARHYLTVLEAGDRFALKQLQSMKRQEQLSDEDSEEFKRVVENLSSVVVSHLSGEMEDNYFEEYQYINLRCAEEVFRLSSHRKQPLLFEPFCSCDPQYAPPEILALFAPEKKRSRFNHKPNS